MAAATKRVNLEITSGTSSRLFSDTGSNAPPLTLLRCRLDLPVLLYRQASRRGGDPPVQRGEAPARILDPFRAVLARPDSAGVSGRQQAGALHPPVRWRRARAEDGGGND